MNEQIFKRVASSSLSQHIGKPVTLLGEFDQLKPSGRMFTVKLSTNDIVTIQLQDPYFKMRAVKLHLDDCELFGRSLDGERHAFFCTHLSAFKRMWTEEGKVYWLRFLITFKMHFESCLSHEMSSDRLVNFIFIFIHKQFVEGSYSTAKNFIENIFMIGKHLRNLPETSLTKNPFYQKESRESFRALFGKPELDDDIPVAVMSFVSSVYFEFASSICAILKKWLQESDLSEELKSKIDYTLFYWRPSEWKDIGCFEKYLADHWKNDLPKMLLTCDIHNIFSNHPADCCNFEKDMNIFELLKDKHDSVHRFRIPHAEILKPSTDACSAHSNCRLKILHDKKCLEPYLCEGSQPCILTCEVSSKRRQHSKEVNQANPWKKILVETFACKEANRRTVCTLAESHCTEIETFYRAKESTCDMGKECVIAHAEDMLCLYQDAEMRNALNQHKRKEQLKRRLRSKLNKKHYSFDPEDYKDPDYCWTLYQQAHQAWIHDMYASDIEEMVLPQENGDEIKIKNSVGNLRRAALTTVAVGTKDVILGRVVYPSKSLCQSHRQVCEEHKQQIRDSKDKKSKSKKKKGNANGILSGKADSGSVNGELKTTAEIPTTSVVSQNSETVPKHNTEYATAVDNPENCDEVGFKIPLTEEKDSNEDMFKNGSAVLSLPVNKKCVVKSCESLPVSKVSDLIDAASNNFLESTSVHYPQHSIDKTNSKDTSSSEKGPIKIVNNSSSDGKDYEQLNVEKDSTESARNVTISNDFKGANVERDRADSDTVVDKFLALIGVTDYTSPQKLNKIDDPTLNENLQCIANGGTDDSDDANPQMDDSTNNDILTLISALEKPSSIPDCKFSSKELDSVGNDLTEKKRKLRICAYCGKKEVQSKTFKRCARCKIEKFREQRYYCSRDCQSNDWRETHQEEHYKRTVPLL